MEMILYEGSNNSIDISVSVYCGQVRFDCVVQLSGI